MTSTQRAKRAAVSRYLSGPRDASLSNPGIVRPQDNVVGVGVGWKIKGGQFTDTRAVRLYVAAKVDACSMPRAFLIPAEIEGVPTDIVETGRMLPAGGLPNPRAQIRPPQPGCSIGVMRKSLLLSGTFGAVVRDNDRRYLLTNNHVLADDDPANIGRPVLQPGPSDEPGDPIAMLSRFVPIRPRNATEIDAAIAELTVPDKPALLEPVGPLASSIPGRADEGMAIEKIGRATGYKTGTVFDVEAEFPIQYSFGAVTLRNQILIHNPEAFFAFSGDSGSLIVERGTKRAIGLLCGCSYTRERGFYGVANHLDRVLRALDVTLVA